MHDFLIMQYPCAPERRKRAKARRDAVVTLWIPKDLKEELDREVRLQDSDRSKVMRSALRLRLRRTA